MSRIDDLVKELCPDGVEYRILGDVCEYPKERIAAADLDGSTFVGVDNLVADKKGRVDATYAPNAAALTRYAEGDVLIGNIRPYLKKVWIADRVGGASGDVLVLHLRADAIGYLEDRFLYYLLSSDRFFAYDMKTSKGAKMPRGDKAAILKYHVPVPPLAVQREIVRILDQFTQLEAELEAELEARRDQYAYYVDLLIGRKSMVGHPWVSLGELGSFHRGKRFVKADYADEGIPCIHYGEIYTKYGVWTDSVSSCLDASLGGRLRFADPSDVILVDVGEVVEDVGRSVAWLGDRPVAIHDHSYAYRSDLEPRFLSYLMRTGWFRAERAKFVARTKVKTLLIEGFATIQIPVPPIGEQRRISDILDKFDTLVNDLNSGLPAEIAARRKQYEYYRERLLTFPEKKAAA